MSAIPPNSAVTEPAGAIGGGQIGYNWQFSPILVAGIEADIQASGERDSITLTNSFNSSIPPVTATAVTNYEAKIDWFGTARARIGYLFGDGAVMTYLTGGLAYGRVGVDGTSTVSGSFAGPTNAASVTHTIGHSQVNYRLDGGLRYGGQAVNSRLDLQNRVSLRGPRFAERQRPPAPITGATGGQTFTHTHFIDNIIRVGLNYQFH
ncbi:MAG: hypothetical protein WB689_34375 [Xanthobacteraceae bacterium]